MTPEAILAAILFIFPFMSGNNRACIIQRQNRIIQQLYEVGRPIEPGAPVPPLEITAAVAFAETHLGCDLNEGGNWGAPISPTRRHVAGTHMHAVRVLVHGYQRCRGSWDQSIMRFRTGLCLPSRSPDPRVRRLGSNYLRTIRSIVGRMHQHHQRNRVAHHGEACWSRRPPMCGG